MKMFRLSKILLGSVAVLPVLLVTGCAEEIIKSTPEDARYVAPPTPGKAAGTELFPGNVGSKWVYDLEIHTSSGNQTVQKGEETAVIVGTKKIGDREGLVWERRRNNGTTLVSHEVYSVDKNGVSQIAMGKNAEFALVPPLTLLQFPAAPGQMVPWKGELKLDEKRRVDSTGAVRVRTIETIETPAGKFDAYRVESTLRTSGQRAQQVLSTSWFAPKIGIVRQEYTENRQLVTKNLRSYQLK